MMRRIGFITFREQPNGTPGDQLAMAALRERGAVVQTAVWDDPQVVWRQFDLLVFRSCWDYFLRLDAFDAWLDEIEQLGIPTLNPLPIIRWNRGKRYLRDLAAAGVDVVPTVWLAQEKTADLAQILAEQDWDEAVVKPVVSGTAFHTWRTTPAQAKAHQPQLEALLAEREMMMQPFLPEIQKTGEFSLLYFDKQFSHAVLKQAVAGDFRVQSDFGGTVTLVEPAEELVRVGESILAAVPAGLAYARVDGVLVNGRFTLLELELVEPELFLVEVPNAAQRLAQAILRLAP